MRTLIIYKSYHHMNTERVAKAMADAMGARLVKVEEADPGSLAEYDLIGSARASTAGSTTESCWRSSSDCRL